jgi:hypothetical protein
MGRLDYQSDDSYTEDFYERDEDVNADSDFEQQREAKFLRDEWAKLDKPHNIRETENLKK